MNTSKKIMVLPMFMLRLLGLFIPLMREMPEMMYQYNRDYFFNSSKFKTHFNFTPASYQEGVKNIVKG
jgi:YHS domain-containing protein